MAFKVEWNSDKIAAQINEAAADALEIEANKIMEESKKLCPKERGENGGLVSTASVVIDKDNLSVKLNYDADHAKAQHENRRLKHKPGEQAQYLAQPMNQNADRLMGAVAQAIRQKIK